MKNYRTALGKTIDMAALASKNEKVRAVGNQRNINARGDTIDSAGKVIMPATKKVGTNYAKTVGNKSAQPAMPAKTPVQKEQLTPEELDLDAALSDDIEIEQIKAKETKGKK